MFFDAIALGVVGFFGASSIERLPTEIAITDCVKQFKGVKIRPVEAALRIGVDQWIDKPCLLALARARWEARFPGFRLLGAQLPVRAERCVGH